MIRTPFLIKSRLLNDPVFALSVGIVSAAGIAAVDYVTDYELRFGVLYLAAVFVATWGAGRAAGISIGVAVSVLWISTLFVKYPYAHFSEHLWEGSLHLVMSVGFALLIARLKDALLLAEERFVSAFDSLEAAACVVDPANGTLLYANPQFARTFSTAGATDLARRLSNRLEEGESFDVDSGRWFYVLSRAMRWLDGRTVRLHVATDITEVKRAENLALEQREQLERTARLIAVGEVASTLAHELNQPLGAIANYNSGAIRMIRSGSADSGALLELMEKCSTQALRAGDVVRRIREFVRKRPPALRAESAGRLVADAVAYAQGETVAGECDIRSELPAHLPAVQADRVLIERVMVNLARNALDSMAGTPAAARSLVISAAPAGDMVEFRFSDRGCGIPEALESRLFQPFVSSKPEGMGLGLAICRSIVEYHRGELWFTRNSRDGTTFHFTLPAAP